MSTFTLVLSLVLVLCVSKALALKRYHSIAGPFKVDIKRLEKCPRGAGAEGPHAASYDLIVRKRHHEQTAYSVIVAVPFVINDSLVLTGNLASWSNNGGWKQNAYQATIKTPCSMMYQHLRGHVEYGLKHLFGEFLGCPFFAGIYRASNVTIPEHLTKSSSTTAIKQFIYGRWRADGKAYTKNGEMVVCGRAYADTIPN